MPTAPDSWVRDRVLWLVVAVTTCLRLFFAWRYFGFLGGDDVEILEEAFRRAGSLEYSPMPIRNLLLPDLVVAPVVKAGLALGLRDASLVLIATLPFIALASVNIVLVYRLAEVWIGDRAAARMAALIYAFHWLPLAFGSTTYPRTASTTFVLLAVLMLSGAKRDDAPAAVGGAALAFAFAIRHSEGMYLIPLLMVAFLGVPNRRDGVRRALLVVGGFALGAGLTVGLYDLLTWGRPFSSFLAVFEFTVVERATTSPAALQPPTFYLTRVLFWLPPTLLPALWLARRLRRVWLAWPFLATPLVVLSLIQFKQLRYLQGAIPFLAVAGAAGFVAMRARWRPWYATALVALTLVSEVPGVRILAGKSMAAVSAARAMASDPGVKAVVLSQAWAYGDRLFFGNSVAVRGIPVPPRQRDLEEAITGADRVALYRRDLEEDASLAAALARHGFVTARRFSWGQSKMVVVFGRE